MALDLFKFLRGNSKRKKKKNYDPSNPLSSTKFLEGMENTSAQSADSPEVIGRGETATRRIPNAPKPLGGLQGYQRPNRRLADEDTGQFLKATESIRAFGEDTGRRTKSGRKIMAVTGIQDMKAPKSDINIFRDQLERIRNKRKSAAQARYDKQMAARNKRSSLFKTRTPEERQAAYDTAFRRPLGENTILGRASANREQRQIDMQKLNVQRKKEREAKKANRENS